MDPEVAHSKIETAAAAHTVEAAAHSEIETTAAAPIVVAVARNGEAAAAPVVVEAASNAVEATINMGVSVRNMNIENAGLIPKSQKKQRRKRGQILRDRTSN